MSRPASSAKPTLTPEVFNAFLEKTTMVAITVRRSATEVLDSVVIGHRDLRFEFGERRKLVSAEANIAIIDAEYVLLVRRGDDPEDGESLARLSVIFQVEYATPFQMSKALFEQFSVVSLRAQTGPFAREWFHDSASNMGIANVLLPLKVIVPPAQPMPVPAPSPRKRKAKVGAATE